ncbi:DUF4347 domain-containing protein [Flagellimonas pacifica]|uniref:DUF4347 domain-containing protein n=1 Tax=Flagellimonas pacifica TaxID=1247520 RepID=A0A285MUF7_9FLAO|nr:DUF4347 domain-containing protein [Allomuricauda parva]SNZ00805.1 protein of unknown function [Allomuricauda parva]
MKNPFYRNTLPVFFFLFAFLITGVFAQSNDIVVIDSKYSQKPQVLNNLPSGTSVVEIYSTDNPWKTIRENLEQNPSIKAIHLFVNTNYNAFELGGILYDSTKIDQEFEFSMMEGLYQGTNIQLLVYDCNLGSNPEGLELMKKVSDRSYFNIGVPTNCSSIFSMDLEFDHTTMNQPVNKPILK